MNGSSKRRAEAAGSILAISIIAGVVGGMIVNQASIGFLVGALAGVTVTVLHWLYDRRR